MSTRTYKNATDTVFLRVPSSPVSPETALFTYIFDGSIFQKEVNRFLKKNRFDSFPEEYLITLEAQLLRLHTAFLEKVGQSVVSAIRKGGFLSSVVAYSGGRPVFRPVNEKAGLRLFGNRTGSLSSPASIKYEVQTLTKTNKTRYGLYNPAQMRLRIEWAAPLDTPKIPGPYVAPYDTANTRPFQGKPPLQREHEQGIINTSVNKVAAIESGSPYQRQLSSTAMRGFLTPLTNTGFRIFEGATYKNTVSLDKAYRAAIRDIFNKGVFKDGNRKLSLNKYTENFLVDTIKDYYAENIAPKKLTDNTGQLKSTEKTFFNELRRILPSNDKFIAGLTTAEIKALFQAFKPGKKKIISKGKIGISDTADANRFKNALQDAFSEFANSF